ncbi:VOC family protein [Clostridia bacterium]|nr:VOC family protein [Clostridia bacterium]
MLLDVFLFFDGDCREAVGFYSNSFGLIQPILMTYGQNPTGCPEEDMDRILYAMLPVCGSNMMFSDCPSGTPYVKGTNFSVTLGIEDEDELRRVFTALSDGGEVNMPLNPTFFSPLFGMLTDKFGIIWQLSLPAAL